MQLWLALNEAEHLWRDQPTVGDAHPIERPVKIVQQPQLRF
jgi:hypothetical protein